MLFYNIGVPVRFYMVKIVAVLFFLGPKERYKIGPTVVKNSNFRYEIDVVLPSHAVR